MITIKEEEKEVSLEALKKFLLEVFGMFRELMRVNIEKQNDMVTPLILDSLFKSLLIKVDDIYSNNKRVIDKAIQYQSAQAEQMRKMAMSELESKDLQIAILKKT